MRGSREGVHRAAAVVFGPLVFVLDEESDGGAERDAEFGAGLDLYSVFLIALKEYWLETGLEKERHRNAYRCGKCALAGSSSSHLRLDIGFCELHSWWAAIDNTADGAAVRFAISGYIHSVMGFRGV